MSIKVANIAKHVWQYKFKLGKYKLMCFSKKKKYVRKLMALKIHAIINTCYKLLINDSTEKKGHPFH